MSKHRLRRGTSGGGLFGIGSRVNVESVDPQRPRIPVDPATDDSIEPDRDLVGAVSGEEAAAREAVHTERGVDDDLHLASARPQETEYENHRADAQQYRVL